MFDCISIIGCGLIGSSIVRAISEKHISKKIVIYDKSNKALSFLKKEIPKVELAKDLFTAIILTIIFVIFINEVFAKELDSLSDEKNEDKGASFNKIEIEKTIQQLKTVQLNM